MRAMTSALIFGMLMTLGQAQSSIAAADANLLDGKWKPVSVSHDGHQGKLPPDAYIKIHEGTFTHGGGGDSGKMEMKLDATKSPHQIDLKIDPRLLGKEGKAAEPTHLGIFKLNGDHLTVCMASITITSNTKKREGDEPADEDEQGFNTKIEVGDRPTAFDDKQGILMVLERVKE